MVIKVGYKGGIEEMLVKLYNIYLVVRENALRELLYLVMIIVNSNILNF